MRLKKDQTRLALPSGKGRQMIAQKTKPPLGNWIRLLSIASLLSNSSGFPTKGLGGPLVISFRATGDPLLAWPHQTA
ncbi:hypothetical protein D0962_09395 [Leptolyngbyaceae cyanobacterium CCMR0082]|uniref:Uncharacterized protein n=1 Tax=Adonisia turfae CCMR0082 TaxID=2304604 RepID=A0A6M0S3N8_9CYAN|nr:hypothetical protein [Adonisia turfae CCMR0082]